LDFLMQNAQLSRQDHTKVVLELLLDLQWAHAQSSLRVERRALGVVCPANTLVTTDGRVRLPRPTGEALRQPAHYAAPERTSDTPPALLHDVHAVGVMLLEMLAGRVLETNEVRGLSPQSLSNAAAWHPHLHDPLLSVALRAIAPIPEHRWSNAGEMAQALGRKAAERVSDRASLAELVRIELERDELLALHGVTGPIPPEDLDQVDAVRVSGFHSYDDRHSGDDWSSDSTPCESPWDEGQRTG
jgi:hypothetical protein